MASKLNADWHRKHPMPPTVLAALRKAKRAK